MAYIAYHLSRKPISIVKNAKAFLDCDDGEGSNGTCTSWITEINGKSEKEAKTYLGLLDTSYLFSYSFFMFLSGFVAERVNLRYFLSLGMLMSGLLTVMFGMAYTLKIHSLWYLIFIQVGLAIKNPPKKPTQKNPKKPT
jgi:OPA family glycerol-3-phosphate transporter-like MFS transporter 1/2